MWRIYKEWSQKHRNNLVEKWKLERTNTDDRILQQLQYISCILKAPLVTVTYFYLYSITNRMGFKRGVSKFKLYDDNALAAILNKFYKNKIGSNTSL